MKVHVDKVQGQPPHCLTIRDVKIILAKLPTDWVKGITHVRLANTQGCKAYMMHSEGRLIIYSRGATKKRVVREILSVLVSPFLNIQNVVARSPQASEEHRIDRCIQPFVEEIMKELETPRSGVAVKRMSFPSDVG